MSECRARFWSIRIQALRSDELLDDALELFAITHCQSFARHVSKKSDGPKAYAAAWIG